MNIRAALQVEALEDRVAASVTPTGIGAAASKTADTRLTIALSQPVLVGNTVIVALAMDPSTTSVRVSDAGANVYSTHVDATRGSRGAGVRTLLFSAPVTTAMAISNTVTITFAAPVAAKAASAFQVTGLVSTSLVDVARTATGSSRNPNSGSTATTAQADTLVIGVMGFEGPSADRFTPGTGFGSLPKAGTSGGGAGTNVSVAPEFRTVSARSPVQASGSLRTARPWAAGVVAFRIAAPRVVGIVPADPVPTQSDSVRFAVTFSESVTGVDTADFTLATSAITGAAISGVSGSGTSYVVTVNSGTGDGTLRLNLVDNDSIKDGDGIPLGGTGNTNGNFTGQPVPIDRSLPLAGTVNDGLGTDVAWQTSTSTVAANWSGFRDGERGIVRYEWAVGTTAGGTQTQPFTSVGLATSASNSSLTLTEGTTYYVTVRAIDAAGNATSVTSSGVVSDAAAPVTTPVVSGTAGTNGWYVSAVSVTLSAADAGSGVNATEYSLDGGQTWRSGTTLLLSIDGTHDIRYLSRDAAGNVESVQSLTVKIDTTPPVVNAAATFGPDESGWYNLRTGAPIIHFAASDSGSGLAPGSIPADVTLGEGFSVGTSVLIFDMAGNRALASVDGLKVDLTAPTITAVLDREANAFGWYNKNVTVAFSVSDDVSGIDNVIAPVTLGEGIGQSVTGTVTDRAGNTATATVAGINIDRTAPQAIIVAAPSVLTSSTSAGFVFSGTDPLSPGSGSRIDRLEYWVDGGNRTVVVGSTGSAVLTNLVEGSHTFHVEIFDRAGNVSATSYTWTIDSLPPSVSAPDLAADSDSGVSDSDNITNRTTVTIRGTAEAGSIVILYVGTTVLGTGTADGNGLWAFHVSLAEATHTLYATAADARGNIATSSALTITVDRTAPTLALPSDLSAAATDPAGAVVTYSASADDAGGSGVSSFGTTPASGSVIGLGSTTVLVSASDLAGNDTAGTFIVNVSYRLPLLDEGTVVSGSGSIVAIPGDRFAPFLDQAFTIDVEVKLSSLAALGYGTIVSKYDSTGSVPDRSFYLGAFPGGRLAFYVYADGFANVMRGGETAEGVLSEDVWQHIAASFDPATQEMTVTVDGQEVPLILSNTGVVAALSDGSTPVRVGAVGGNKEIFPGLIRNAFVSHARSTEEVANDPDQSETPQEEEPPQPQEEESAPPPVDVEPTGGFLFEDGFDDLDLDRSGWDVSRSTFRTDGGVGTRVEEGAVVIRSGDILLSHAAFDPQLQGTITLSGIVRFPANISPIDIFVRAEGRFHQENHAVESGLKISLYHNNRYDYIALNTLSAGRGETLAERQVYFHTGGQYRFTVSFDESHIQFNLVQIDRDGVSIEGTSQTLSADYQGEFEGQQIAFVGDYEAALEEVKVWWGEEPVPAPSAEQLQAEAALQAWQAARAQGDTTAYASLSPETGTLSLKVPRGVVHAVFAGEEALRVVANLDWDLYAEAADRHGDTLYLPSRSSGWRATITSDGMFSDTDGGNRKRIAQLPRDYFDDARKVISLLHADMSRHARLRLEGDTLHVTADDDAEPGEQLEIVLVFKDGTRQTVTLDIVRPEQDLQPTLSVVDARGSSLLVQFGLSIPSAYVDISIGGILASRTIDRRNEHGEHDGSNLFEVIHLTVDPERPSGTYALTLRYDSDGAPILTVPLFWNREEGLLTVGDEHRWSLEAFLGLQPVVLQIQTLLIAQDLEQEIESARETFHSGLASLEFSTALVRQQTSEYLFQKSPYYVDRDTAVFGMYERNPERLQPWWNENYRQAAFADYNKHYNYFFETMSALVADGVDTVLRLRNWTPDAPYTARGLIDALRESLNRANLFGVVEKPSVDNFLGEMATLADEAMVFLGGRARADWWLNTGRFVEEVRRLEERRRADAINDSLWLEWLADNPDYIPEESAEGDEQGEQESPNLDSFLHNARIIATAEGIGSPEQRLLRYVNSRPVAYLTERGVYNPDGPPARDQLRQYFVIHPHAIRAFVERLGGNADPVEEGQVLSSATYLVFTDLLQQRLHAGAPDADTSELHFGQRLLASFPHHWFRSSTSVPSHPGFSVRTDTELSYLYRGLSQRLWTAPDDLVRSAFAQKAAELFGVDAVSLTNITRTSPENFALAMKRAFVAAGHASLFHRNAAPSLLTEPTLRILNQPAEYTHGTLSLSWDLPARTREQVTHAAIYIYQAGHTTSGEELTTAPLTGILHGAVYRADVPIHLIGQALRDRGWESTNAPPVILKVAVWKTSPGEPVRDENHDVLTTDEIKVAWDGSFSGTSATSQRVTDLEGQPLSVQQQAQWESLVAKLETVWNDLDEDDLTFNAAMVKDILEKYVLNGQLMYDGAKSGGDFELEGTLHGTKLLQCKRWLQQDFVKQATQVIIPPNVTKDSSGTTIAPYEWVAHERVEEKASMRGDITFEQMIYPTNQVQIVREGDLVQMVSDGREHTMVIATIEEDGMWVFDTNFGEKGEWVDLPDTKGFTEEEIAGDWVTKQILDSDTGMYRPFTREDRNAGRTADRWYWEDNTIRLHRLTFQQLNASVVNATVYRVTPDGAA